jgi:aromatic amino acid aminotransferase I / 2-aminoadipate transaminase
MAPHADRDMEVTGVTDTTAVAVPDPVVSKTVKHPIFTVDDVFPHRQENASALKTGVAAFSSADLFKSKGAFRKPKAKRFDHRVSIESAARQPSSLKGAMKYFRPDMISLCGGLPSSDYFPFESMSVKVPSAPHFSEPATRETGNTLTSGKHDINNGTSQFDLSVALNYGQSMGPPQLMRWITEHTEIVHDPKYSDWDICMTSGSTSALEVALRLFCNRGDYLITEEYSFSSAMETARPMGLHLLGIPMDERGMLPSALDEVLSNWDTSARKALKPFVMYTVPTGQNPTASTQDTERRKEIYAIAEKHDLYILEDEPYYFLQMDPYIPGHTHTVPSPFSPPTTVPQFLAALIPSFLSLDTSGRVLRLDSFSKILAPGSRCGWVTGPAQIIERFIRNNEVSSQTPSGFSEIALYKLLEENWGHKGFLEWLMFIRAEYTRRRDVIVNACERYLPTEVASWTPPRAGMFHWIEVDLTKHPKYHKGINQEEFLAIEEQVFLAGVERGVLLARGSWFRAERGSDQALFMRTTFAAASEEKIQEGIERMGKALRSEFGLEQTDSATNGVANGVATNGHGAAEYLDDEQQTAANDQAGTQKSQHTVLERAVLSQD